jgi:glutamyl-tRNA synthetase
MTLPVRTRFAPSPTGFLHVGSARTALYSWLYARKHQGTFILRIEDTDRERSTQEAVDAILDAMAWLHLDWDEGPFYQTQRFDHYVEIAQQMVVRGQAYRCDCSKERLEQMRIQQQAQKQKPKYDGHCRYRTDVDPRAPHVIRFANPETGVVEIPDAVKGRVIIQNAELDDLVIVRTDGTPTYNFTVVVDDWEMQITHVIRGDDHLTNTPRQINMLQALGAPIPIYAHIPMILGADGKRLSKRHGAVSVQQYREAGYLPHALLNYLIRLGWSQGDQEIFSREEMIALFDIDQVHGAPTIFNPEKFAWLNQHYIKTMDTDTMVDAFVAQLKYLDLSGPFENSAPREVLLAQRERAKTLKEMAEKSRYFYEEPVHVVVPEEAKPALQALKNALSALNTWDKESIHAVIAQVAEQHALKLGQLAQPLRLAVTGGTVSPSIDLTLQLIGKARVLERLQRVL